MRSMEKGDVAPASNVATPDKNASAVRPGAMHTLQSMTTPLRQQNIGNSAAARSGSPDAGSPGPYPMGPPMTEMTGVHAGTVLSANGKVSHGPLHPDDEREMVQLMYEMISYE